MEINKILVLIIILISSYTYWLDQQWIESYSTLRQSNIDLQTELDSAQENNIYKAKQIRTLDTDKHKLSQEIIRLNKKIRDTHLTYIDSVKEIDKVNSDFESYGNSRYQEGYIRAIYWGCLHQVGLIDYCGAISADAYSKKVYEDDAPEWDSVWAIIRGLVGKSS